MTIQPSKENVEKALDHTKAVIKRAFTELLSDCKNTVNILDCNEMINKFIYDYMYANHADLNGCGLIISSSTFLGYKMLLSTLFLNYVLEAQDVNIDQNLKVMDRLFVYK
jgi:hypothetical protein